MLDGNSRHPGRPGQAPEDHVPSTGGETQQHDDAVAEAAETAPARHPARTTRRAALTLGLAAALLIAVTGYVAYAVAPRHQAAAPLRPSGIPANISTSLANLMTLSPVPGIRAPGFTLTDQTGRTLTLASLRGKVVVLEFMDPHCTDICPIVSQEFVTAYHDLGPLASKVVFVAVNVNQYHRSVRDMAAYSKEHQLNAIPSWHFFTGPVPALRATWKNYNILVHAPNPNADIIHTSALYFIDARGMERYLAAPMADHTKKGASYLPLRQVNAWGHGIAIIARDLVR
jgi:cytochrome oxidase Cu insertion factor (SCO1/SenC/PrrC family)